MELPSIPEPEIKTNPITKSESVKLSKAEFDKIKQVIDYQQTQITSLEAQKSDLSAKLKNVESKLDIARKKPYMRENETLMQNLENESNFSEKLTKKYGKLSNQYFELNESYKQERLIDGVSEYGSALAKDNEYPELAKQMDNKVGIDESIESFVKLPEPERTRESRSSRDWDIEL